MATPFIRKFWPTLAHTISFMCKFINRHHTVLVQVVNDAIPNKAAEVATAFAAISAACAVFQDVMTAIDPNWRP